MKMLPVYCNAPNPDQDKIQKEIKIVFIMSEVPNFWKRE